MELGNGINTVILDIGGQINGNLNLGSNSGSKLVLDGSGTENVSQAVTGTITNNGFLTKQGPGTWVVDDQLAAPGGTTITSGTLQVAGTLVTPETTITGSGLVNGSGTITGNLTNSALFNPSGLALLGNFTQTASGTYLTAITSPTNYQQLTAGGKATLDGRLDVSYLNGFVPQPGNAFTIIRTGGGIAGQFASLQLPTAQPLSIHYEGNNVVLTAVTLPPGVSLPPSGGVVSLTPFEDFALTRNQTSVGRALDSVRFTATGDLGDIATLLTFLPASTVRKALDRISPQMVPLLLDISYTLLNAQTADLEERLATLRSGVRNLEAGSVRVYFTDPKSTIDKEPAEAKTVASPPKADKRLSSFISAGGVFAHIDSIYDLPAYDSNTGTVTAGVDYQVLHDLFIGVYGGYAGTRADFNLF